MSASMSFLNRTVRSLASAKPSRLACAPNAVRPQASAFSTKAAPKAKASKSTKATPKADAPSSSETASKSKSGNVQLVKGTTLDTHSLDFRTARVGQVLEVPYELTMDASWSNLWQSKFFQHDRLYTSKLFAQQLGFPSFLLPYTMLLFHTGSMSHLDDERAVLDLGFRNAVYENPAVPGETFKKVFTIKGLRPTADNKRTVITVHCELINVATNVRVFSVDKRMIYPERLPDSHYVKEPAQQSAAPPSNILSQLEEQAAALTEARWRSLVNLEAGQLALHTQCRRLGLDNHLNLCTQARLTHPLILNTVRIKTADIAIPGGVLLPLAHSATARDTYEVLHEQIDNASFLNPANPDDTIGAFSFVHSVEEREHLQVVSLQTFGVKNLDVQTDLAKVKLPVSLFTSAPLKPREYDEILAEHCPQLKDKLVTVANRKLYRLSSYGSHSRIFLL